MSVTTELLQYTHLFYKLIFIPIYNLPYVCITLLTPWKNPLNLGTSLIWSFINLTLRVSIGVTANIASSVPAPEMTNHN